MYKIGDHSYTADEIRNTDIMSLPADHPLVDFILNNTYI
jgi:hypothetical protein